MMKISLAGLKIAIDNRYPFIEELAKDYITSEEEVDFTVSVSDEDLKEEDRMSEVRYPLGYLESIALYRKIAEKIPEYGAFVFHGAVMALDGAAYAVTARSGVGKTTHVRLWLEAFGERVHILNGDKPIIRVIDGIPYACGTPWRGKENYGIPEMLPLRSVAFLERSAENSAEKISVGSALMRFVSQIYIPKTKETASLALIAANRVISSVSLYELHVNMDISAAHEAMKVMSSED